MSDDEYKEKYLFTFEEMIRVELKGLKEGLGLGGNSFAGAMKKWDLGNAVSIIHHPIWF